MALFSPYLTHLAVRWVHVLGMAALFGGAALVWVVLQSDAVDGATRDAVVVGGSFALLDLLLVRLASAWLPPGEAAPTPKDA